MYWKDEVNMWKDVSAIWGVISVGLCSQTVRSVVCLVPSHAEGRGDWGPELGLLWMVFGYAELRKKRIEG